MSESEAHPARTAAQLLDREEALAIQRIHESLQGLGERVLIATDLRGEIRRHPLLATGLGACLGFVGGPALLRTTRRVLGASSGRQVLRALRDRALQRLP